MEKVIASFSEGSSNNDDDDDDDGCIPFISKYVCYYACVCGRRKQSASSRMNGGKLSKIH